MKPLSKIVILDLSRVLAGPFATMILRNLGARIIKVETPLIGDDSRHFGPFYKDNESAYFTSVNSGKESICLNLKTKKGVEILRKMAKQSDVLVENYTPKVMKKFNLDYDALRKINDSLIYCSISGFGQFGPWSTRPAYDMIVQAAGGIMSLTGHEPPDNNDNCEEPLTEPVRVGSSIGDITASLFAAIGISTALYNRNINNNKGVHIDISMLDCQLSILENAIARYQVVGVPTPLGSAHPTITPFQAFKTHNKGEYIAVAAGNDKLFKKLCSVINRKDIAKNKLFLNNGLRAQNRHVLANELNTTFRTKECAYWVDHLTKSNIPCSKINNMEDVFNHDQLKARGMFLTSSFSDNKPICIANNPIIMSNFKNDTKVSPAPQLGSNSNSVLKEFCGFSDGELASLRSEKVI